MNLRRGRLAYFSPTQTTRRVLQSIAAGMDLAKIKDEDLTAPDARTRFIAPVAEDEIALLGSPVYCGRLPQEGALRLRRLEGHDAPAVVVVVYGNREYGDALLELRDLAIERGFRPIAGAASIGEHSFCSAEYPIAVGRPDAVDLTWARELGREVSAQLASLSAPAAIPLLEVPGNLPYEEIDESFGCITPVTLFDTCDACGACAQACPAAAISVNGVAATKAALCIMCCACVRVCPNDARVLQAPQVLQAAEWLSIHCAEPKQPVWFTIQDTASGQ